MNSELSVEFPLKSEVKELSSSSPTDSVSFNTTSNECSLSLEIMTEPVICKSDEGERYSCDIDSTGIEECPTSFKSEIKEEGDIEVWIGIQEKYMETDSEVQVVEKPFSVKGAPTFQSRTHPGKKLFQCSDCQKSFASQNIYMIHKKIHYRSTPISCDESQQSGSEESRSCKKCGKIFSGNSSLTNHMRLYHTAFKCRVCLKSFSSKAALGSHSRIHKGKESFPCKMDTTTPTKKFSFDDPKRSFSTKSHMKNFTLECKECVKTFSQSQHLTEHLRFHSKEGPPYLCRACGTSFSIRTHLENHKRIHKGKKIHRYVCSFCRKSFFLFSQLESHEKVHTGELHIYICSVCSQEFSSCYLLKEHEKVTHSSTQNYTA